MAYRCPHYRCEASSIEGLIQQVALSYLRHGYWWYVTGIVPTRKDPTELDHNILTKYDIRKDWRFIAHNKARGVANLQYIRCGSYFAIMATKGLHEFKTREAKRIRDARHCPILVPKLPPVRRDAAGPKQRSRRTPTFDGYAISYRRGGFLKKTPDEKQAYRDAIEHWKQQKLRGKRLPRPARGTPDPKWHSCVELERSTQLRLRSYFLEIGTRRSPENLAFEFANTGYVPYQPVKHQLVRIIKDVNKVRQVASCSEQIAYRVVLGMKRKQVFPFEQISESHAALALESA